VDRGVKAESLLDNGLVERQLGKVVISQGRQIGTEFSDLLLVQLLHDVRVLSETEHDPRAGRRRRVLAGHEKSNHHVGDFMVRDRGAVLVSRVHEMLHHIVLSVIVVLSSALLNGVHIDFGNSALGVVTLAVPGERSPVKHEVDGGETHIKIVVESGQRLVKLVANDAALKGMRSSEDSDLGHLLRDVDNTGLALKIRALLKVIANLGGDDRDVGSEGLGGKGDLHELKALLSACLLRKDLTFVSDLLLFHEFGIRAVVDDILAKDRSSENSINLLGRDILELSVENKVVSSGANSDGGFLSKEDKGEDIAMLAQSQLFVTLLFLA
jgi:hypothetical protein